MGIQQITEITVGTVLAVLYGAKKWTTLPADATYSAVLLHWYTSQSAAGDSTVIEEQALCVMWRTSTS